ncbi:MAG: hypothetical protein ACYCST_12125 [Acidimicrobiales bacterium]
MAGYGIDEAVLRTGQAAGDQGQVGETSLVIPSGAYQAAFLQLLDAVATANHCVMWYETRRRDFDRVDPDVVVAKAYIVGFEAEREHVELLFDSLLLQLTLALQAPETVALRNEEAPGRRAAWNSTFTMGFSGEIAQRLEAANEAARRGAEEQHGNEVVALALRDVDTAVQKWLDENHGHIRSTSSRAGIWPQNAWEVGGAAGANADIGQSRVPPTRRALPQ